MFAVCGWMLMCVGAEYMIVSIQMRFSSTSVRLRLTLNLFPRNNSTILPMQCDRERRTVENVVRVFYRLLIDFLAEAKSIRIHRGSDYSFQSDKCTNCRSWASVSSEPYLNSTHEMKRQWLRFIDVALSSWFISFQRLSTEIPKIKETNEWNKKRKHGHAAGYFQSD